MDAHARESQRIYAGTAVSLNETLSAVCTLLTPSVRAAQVPLASADTQTTMTAEPVAKQPPGALTHSQRVDDMQAAILISQVARMALASSAGSEESSSVERASASHQDVRELLRQVEASLAPLVQGDLSST